MTITYQRSRSWAEEKWSNPDPVPGVVTVRDYFNTRYRPERLANAPRKYLLSYFATLSMLEMHLDNDPVRLDIEALTQQDLQTMCEAAIKAGFSPKTVEMRMSLLSSIMHHASPMRFPGRKNRKAVWSAHADAPLEMTSDMPLIVYLKRVFFAERKYNRNYETTLWNAIEKITECIGEPARVRHLHDRIIMQTLNYCRQKGLSPSTVRKHGDSLRALWKHAIGNSLAAPGILSRGCRKLPRYLKTDPLDGSDGSLWWYCVNRYFPANLRVRSGKTKHQYNIALRSYKRFLDHEPALADLEDDTVIAWMGRLRDEGLSAKTINERSGRVAALWKWLAKKRIVEQFPSVPRLKQPKRIPRAWTWDELERIYAASKQAAGKVDGFPASDWWPALILVCANTAERIGAIREIKWKWLDWETGILSVPAEVRKSGERDMVYKVHAETLDALKRIHRPEAERMFWYPGYTTKFYSRYKAILKAAGLPHDRYCGFHKIRRTVASYMQKAGHDACSFLQHSSPSVTIESYLDPAIVGTSRPCDILPRLGGKDGGQC